MFSGNNKISVRQTKYLLQLDWIARLVILLPVCLSGKTVGSAIFCVLAGTAAWWLLLNGVLSWTGAGREIAKESLTRQSKGAKSENQENRGGVSREMKEVMGSGASILLYVAGLLFFLVQAAVFLNLTASVCSVYLLPEVPVPLICLLPIAAAVLLASGSIEVQGRFCEVVGPIVVTVLTGLIFLSAFGMNGYVYEETVVQLSDHLVSGSFEVFACLGGLSLPLVGRHLAGELPAQTVKKSGLASALLAGSLCAITIGSYGKNGMLQMEFPAIRVMSNLRLPGVFLQRWDVLFFGFLLVCLTVTAAESLWCVKEILGALWELGDEVREALAESKGPERAGAEYQKVECLNCRNERNGESTLKAADSQGDWKRRNGEVEVQGTDGLNCQTVSNREAVLKSEESLAGRNTGNIVMSWSACIFLIYLAAAGFLSQWTAIGYYRALNLQLLTPAIFLFYIIAGWVRKRKTAVNCPRGLILVLLALVSAFFLGGCTAYEPEERLFPMALEIRAEEGQLVMAYAWNEGAGPGSVGAEEEAANEESEADKAAEASTRKSAEAVAKGQTVENEIVLKEQMTESENVVKEQTADNETVVKKQPGENETTVKEQIAEDETAVKEQASGKYAETRDGITIFRGNSLKEIQEKTTAFSERYMDYSHVKAILLDRSLSEVPELERTVIGWLAQEPAFASGLIIYETDEEELALEQVQRQAGGQVGKYLENLYKNNETYREQSTTLGQLIAEYYA